MTDKYCLLPLSTQGNNEFFTRVDPEDYPLVSLFRWTYTNGYVARKERGNKHVSLHRFLLNPEKGEYVDHINGDGLDNRRKNLRICTQQENTRNKRASSRNKLGFKGVSFMRHGKRLKRWIAKINLNGKQKHIGYFMSPEEAASAYNEVALCLFGDFARLNTIYSRSTR